MPPHAPALPRPFRAGTILLLLLVASCGGHKPSVAVAEASAKPSAGEFIAQSGHSPPFARMPYEPFTRLDAVAIAMQEWRLFGQPVDDDPPGTRVVLGPDEKPERQSGLWERIGEYWFLGQDADRRESAWTGLHDENGQEFDDHQDGYYAWSAAFISYVMRTAGAGSRFPYSPEHSYYINIAAGMAQGTTSGWAVTAERLDSYAPVLGDLVCMSRGRRKLRFENLPARSFPGHCDIVVDRKPGQISVVGGNVDDAVTMKHVPVNADGMLADPGEQVLDTRYNWLAVLRILYDR